MKPRNFTLFVAALTTAIVPVFGIAFANAKHETHHRHASGHVSALDQPAHLTAAQRHEWRRMKRRMGLNRRVGIAATADYADPHPISLPDGLGSAWVMPAADGAVCTFIPDPLGGYGSSCATQDDLAAGGTVTMLGGSGDLDGEAIAVMVVPDGTAAPTVTMPDGQQYVADVAGFGADVVPANSTLQIGAHRIVVPEAR